MMVPYICHPLSLLHGQWSLRIVLAGRVLFEFDCSPVVATIIYDGVFKRMPLAMMLVDGNKHRNPAKVQ